MFERQEKPSEDS